MFLNKIAQAHMTEKFDGFDAVTREFIPNSFQGRIDLTDRFLSIYNRPTRKRQLFVKPYEPLPASMVFKHSATGQTYILGSGRMDARGDVNDGNPYVMLCMVHQVTENFIGSSGVCKHKRKMVAGTPADPGWLIDVEVDETYIDLEFRTSSSDSGTLEEKIQNFSAWMPLVSEVEQWDVIELHGKTYRVVDTFVDIGMRGLRLDQEPDPRINLVVHARDRVYNPVTHEFEDTVKDSKVTAIVSEDSELSTWASNRDSSFVTIIIKKNHIGFEPKVNTQISYQGRKRTIKSVSSNANEIEYKVICE